MITPVKLVGLFQEPAIWTYSARCPVCGQHGLRIYSGSGETKIRCINNCRRVDILAHVGLAPGDLRSDILGLTTGLVPINAVSTQVAPEVQDATQVEGGE
jgi:hypothetical protein